MLKQSNAEIINIILFKMPNFRLFLEDRNCRSINHNFKIQEYYITIRKSLNCLTKRPHLITFESLKSLQPLKVQIAIAPKYKCKQSRGKEMGNVSSDMSHEKNVQNTTSRCHFAINGCMYYRRATAGSFALLSWTYTISIQIASILWILWFSIAHGSLQTYNFYGNS